MTWWGGCLPVQGDPEGVPGVGVSLIVARRGILGGEETVCDPPASFPWGCNLIPWDSPMPSRPYPLCLAAYSFPDPGAESRAAEGSSTHAC